MTALLEVIVVSADEARMAEAGGADRLELLSSPEDAGLTPSLATVESVLEAVSIPVRVMLRFRPSMSIGSAAEMHQLRETAAQFSRLPVDGIVAGFVANDAIDEAAMREILAAAPGKHFTFHRAFDSVADKRTAVEALKRMGPQVDRLLTSAAEGEWPVRLAALSQLAQAAAPEVRVIFAAGRDAAKIADVRMLGLPIEVHVGRAARDPESISGVISPERIAVLKQTFQ